MHTPSLRAALFCSALIPTSVLADVTPQDVWQNMQDTVQPMGITLSAETSGSADMMSLSGVTYHLDLPFDAGSLTLDLGQLDLKAQGDGTVQMLYPQNATYTLTFTSTEGVSQTGSMGATYEDADIVASGLPGDVTYDYDVARMDITLDDIVIPELIDFMSMQGFVEDYKGSFRTTVGEMVKVSGSYTMGQQEAVFTQRVTEDGVTVETEGKQSAKTMAGGAQFTMPRDGMSILNLATALRAGLSIEFDAAASDYLSEQTSSVDGQQIMSQSALTELYEVQMGLDQNGLGISGPMRNATLDVQMVQPVPLQLGMEIESGAFDMLLPLLKDDQFAPYRISFDLTGFRMDDSVWALFDPSAVLPRTPADVALKARGHARSMVEWLDFLTVDAAMAKLTGMAVEAQDLTLETLRVSAAGAEIIGNGAMTFDNSGSEPLPIGTANFELNGINGLIDLLIQAGLLTDQDATGARMGLAMMTVPAADGGEDQLTTEVEMTPEGHVYVNGNRMK